jgi:O-methyltransferase involved in polyketide biosynthesis
MLSPALISDGALWAVACRAHETRRADRVLDDPFASHLTTDRGEELFFAGASVASFVLTVAAATIDDVLQRAVHNHHIHTVAEFGAGLGTRPYRLELPSDLRWIETDLEPVLGYKVLRLAHAAPHCQVRRLNVDLSDAGQRNGVLPEIARDVTRGLVLTEGLVMSGREVIDDLIERIPPMFKYWIADTILPRFNVSSISSERENYRAEPAVAPKDILDAFERRRWQPTEFRPLKEQALRLGEARSTGLAAHSPGELEGIWLFHLGL